MCVNIEHSTFSEGIWKDKSSHYATSDNNSCNVTGVQHVQANGKWLAFKIVAPHKYLKEPNTSNMLTLSYALLDAVI
jgi:hypothetical protein